MRRLMGWILFLMLCIVCPFSLAEDGEEVDWRDALDEDELALYAFIDGSTATIPLSEAVAMHRLGITKAQASQLIYHNTTSIAYQSLIFGASHGFDNVAKLIFVTAPSKYELEDAQEEEVELELIPVAHDALVFLNNVQNPVKGLSSRQLLDIYTGKITSWKEVGGEDAPVIPFQRNRRSGSQTLFMDLLMREEKPMDAPAAYRPDSMGFLIQEVSNYENGKSSLGYSVYYYVSDMYGSEQVRMLAVDGVSPTPETIMDHRYPFYTYYYAVVRKDLPEDHPLRELVAWLLTNEGQRVVQDAGYIPLRDFEVVP